MSTYLILLLALVFGYLLGSIPFGVVLTRLTDGPDLRTIGSGNIGATNVLRTGRKGLALATLMCDAFKGTVAIWLTAWIAARYADAHAAPMIAGLGAFLGHLFPVWLKFRGGKGVATYIGILIGLFPFAALLFCGVWLVTAVISKYSSLSALIASLITPLFLWWAGLQELALLTVLLTLLLWFKHRENISRLLAGTEGKIGKKA